MKTCTKCKETLPLECFHTETHRGRKRVKSKCISCTHEYWAERSAILRGVAPPSEMAAAFNGWHGLVGLEAPPLAWRVRA